MSESLYLIIRFIVFFFVERPKSYYDWQQSLKWKQLSKEQLNLKKINSLGIDDFEFKQYLKKWKKKNIH